MPRRILQGRVVSAKCDKTVIVLVERRFMHPLYKKFIRRTKRFAAHDELNTCQEGDRVRIRECRPISKRKRWEVFVPDAGEVGADAMLLAGAADAGMAPGGSVDGAGPGGEVAVAAP